MSGRIIATYIIPALLVLTVCATQERRTATDFLCEDDPGLRYSDRIQFSSCLTIDPGKYHEYEFFTLSAENIEPEKREETIYGLKDEMERKIVALVMGKIQRAMEKEIVKYWQFEKTRIPVTIKAFVKKDGKVLHVKMVAAMTKYSLSPRGIVTYLPLEYKMHLLEKTK